MKLLLTTAVAALFATSALADTVRIGTEGLYPPYNFLNDDGEVDGFEIELGNELCARAKLECEWVTNDWDSIIPNLVSGNYDAIIAGMSITDERDEVIDFTQNYYPPAPSAYAALSADADVAGGVIAAQAATLQSAYIAETGSDLLEYTAADETVAAVRSGEADAVFADKDFLVPLVEESGGELVWAGEDVALGGGIGIGLRESDVELRETLDAAIQSMKDDGTLNELLIKWFGENITTY